MRLSKYLLLIILPVALTSCRYSLISIVHDDGERNMLLRGTESSNRDFLRCRWDPNTLMSRARVEENRIGCYIVNSSTNDTLILWRGREGYHYVLKYLDRDGCLKEQSNLEPGGLIMDEIEVLSPLAGNVMAIQSWNSTIYEIKLPDDCEKIVGLWLKIGALTFQEIGMCRSSLELYRMFRRKSKYVEVEWWDD